MPDQASPPLRVGVLISGSGTTLVNFLKERDAGRLAIEIPIVLADRECGGISKSVQAGIPCEVLPRRSFENTAAFSQAVFDRMRAARVQLVALAGFLARIDVPDDFHLRVMNIHPSLIPAFCGKGMYGHHVHEAVIARGCKVSGCTVHFADSEYDHGPIILQKCVPVLDEDTPATLAARVFEAECVAFPEAIRWYAARQSSGQQPAQQKTAPINEDRRR